MTDVEVVKIGVVEPEKPVPLPFVAPEKPVEAEDREPFAMVEKDETLEQLRNNIEEEIKRAGEPVDAVIKLLEKFEELDQKVRDGSSSYMAWETFRMEYAKVQRKLGEATGYRAALASSVLAFVLERRRR